MSELCSKGCGRPASRRGYCKSHYMQQRERQLACGRWEILFTDAEPVRAHIERLRSAGLGLRRIAELAEVNRKTLQWVTRGRPERGTPPSNHIAQVNAEKILAVPIPEAAHRAASPHQLVPGVGTMRRLQALVAFGYPRSYLAGRLGIAPSNATHLFRGADRVTAGTARRAEALFTELQMAPGPSNRARNDGKRRRWVLPFAWNEDEIDDPAAVPARVEPDRDRADTEAIARRRERVSELTQLGWSASRIATQLRITVRTVSRDRVAVAESARVAGAECANEASGSVSAQVAWIGGSESEPGAEAEDEVARSA